jgi:hypothetical protein
MSRELLAALGSALPSSASAQMAMISTIKQHLESSIQMGSEYSDCIDADDDLLPAAVDRFVKWLREHKVSCVDQMEICCSAGRGLGLCTKQNIKVCVYV